MRVSKYALELRLTAPLRKAAFSLTEIGSYNLQCLISFVSILATKKLSYQKARWGRDFLAVWMISNLYI